MNRTGDSLHHTGSNKSLVQAFVSAKVEFLVVGGLAMSWYVPTLRADDMDLLINPTKGNSARVAQALASRNLQGFQKNSFARLGLQVPLKNHLCADLLTPRPNGVAYVEMDGLAVLAKLFGIPVWLALAESLIQMKQAAVAANPAEIDKHRKDIELLAPHVV